MTDLTRRDLLGLGIGLAGSALLPAPGAAQQKPATGTAGTPRRGGSLIVLVQNDWTVLDPVFGGPPNGMEMIYDRWIRWEKDPKTGQWGPRPQMVAEWDLRAGTEVVLKLQRGIKFHDGTPWDAAAAKWNLDRMIFDPASRMRAYFGSVDTSRENAAELERLKQSAAQTFDYASKAVEVFDSYTVKLHLRAPNAPILSVLSPVVNYSYPVSPTAYRKLGKAAFNRSPVGAGPFRFVEWKSGSHVLLRRNPDYWQMGADDKPLPYLDEIRYRLVIDDSVRFLELRSGTAHFTELIQAKDAPTAKSDPQLVYLESQDSANAYRLTFDAANAASPFVREPALRLAFLHALDREAMARILGLGAGASLRYLLPKGSFAYDDSVPSHGHDRARAQTLVKQAVAANPSLAGPDGRVAVTLSVPERPVDKAVAEMIKQMADNVGFDVRIDALERAAMTSKVWGEKGQYHAAIMRNPVVAGDPDSQWSLFFHSKGFANVTHLREAAWDGLIDTARATTDTAKRKALYRQMAQRAYDQAWFGYLWQQNWNWVHARKVKNFVEPVADRWIFTEVWLE